ncbi:DVU_1553 family AMP-dependent CoA ligase [Sporomusa malonica]|uniref:Phenylacetate-coenzyme A ligase PaaK, adenylate-forming domain family n=1 Tax=Sporomusa malonica TaxID=112901 RepID=A0A1W2EQ28_9FIRM|nr:AMP-binding protein [Sporomusa malonica]SMD11642.1 Phenylacetate-coenzyme A ligase PaaK, adenylate-forming domain family [Sporomusa malonica]
MTTDVRITPLDAWIAGKMGTAGGRVTREQINCYQLIRLNETISRARSLSPFYRKHLAGMGLNGLTRLEQIAEYPLTTAADVTAHALQMVCVSQSQINRVVTLNTSGTSGNPKRIYFSPFDQELTIDFFQCGMSTLVGPGDKALILLPGERPGSVGDLLLQALLRLGVLPTYYGLVENVPKAVLRMCQVKANCLVGVPVQVLAMARYWEKWGGSEWAPRCALLSTDHIPAAITRELKRIWNCEVYEHYGMTEMGLGGGLECAAHEGCHMREADLYFEIVDPVSAQPLPDGEYGEVVFTTLTRQGMPLIRYRTGDISRFIVNQCQCGSILRRLERVRSRKDGTVCFGEGWEFTIADLDEVLFALPEVTNFTAEVNYGEITKLKLVIVVLADGQPPDQPFALSALRQLPAIQAAEQAGKLMVEVEFVRNLTLSPAKRSIRVTGLAREGVGSAV